MIRLTTVDSSRPTARCAAAVVLIVFGAFAGTSRGDTIVDFQDLSLPANSYGNGSDGSGGFTSNGVGFNNSYDIDPEYGGTWSGWAYSNVVDTTHGLWTNQYAAYSEDGKGLGSNGIYAVAYVGTGSGGVALTITIPDGMQVASAMITNTTYAAITVRDGNGYSQPFGTTDWFLLTISGEGTSNKVDFWLAKDGSIVSDWQPVDLSPLSAAKTLDFTLTSTDNDPVYGMNTPAYFALGSLTLEPSPVPEPATGAMILGGLAALLVWQRRRNRQ